MRVTQNKTSKGTSFYIIRSVSGGSTEIVEKLGTEKEIKDKYHCDDALDWAKRRAKLLTEKENESRLKVMVPLQPHLIIERDKARCFNVGYLFLQQIYYELRIPGICLSISKRHAFEYNLNEILSRLVYCRVLYPSSKLSTTRFSQRLLEQPSFEYQQVQRALSVIAEESDFIQEKLYKNSAELVPRQTKILYYDCTNFYFEIEEEKGMRKYGHNKENRPNPIVQMGLFMDYSGIPLAFVITDGSQNEQTTMVPLEKQIMKDFELSNFVVCTDAGLSSAPNRMFNNCGERSFVTTQSLKKLKKGLQDWALDPRGWKLPGEKGTFDISKIDSTDELRQKNYEKVFYKETFVEGYDDKRDVSFDQTMFVTYSLKYRDYLRSVRNAQVERARKMIESGESRIERKGQQDVRRFINRTSTTKEGEKASRTTYTIDQEAIAEEERFDGFYAVCTNLEADIEDIIRVNRGRWEIEESFRIMKSEFGARPVYLQRDDRIKAHFLTCFIALLVYRILEKKVGDSYTCRQLVDTLRSMEVTSVGDAGYLPSYTRTELTDCLHETAGFRTDYELLRKKYMQGIIRRSKDL